MLVQARGAILLELILCSLLFLLLIGGFLISTNRVLVQLRVALTDFQRDTAVLRPELNGQNCRLTDSETNLKYICSAEGYQPDKKNKLSFVSYSDDKS